MNPTMKYWKKLKSVRFGTPNSRDRNIWSANPASATFTIRSRRSLASAAANSSARSGTRR